MRILLMTGQFPFPPDSGWNIRTYNFIRFLSQRHEITLLSFYTEKDNPACFSELFRYCSTVLTIKRSSSYNPFSLAKGLLTSIPFTIWNYRSKEMDTKALELLALREYQVIQVEDIHMSQYLPQGGCGLKILDMHNIESQFIERFSKIETNILRKLYAYITSKKLKDYEIINSRKFDICLTVSEEERKTFQFYAQHKSIKVVPNGVDLSYFSPSGVEADPFTLLFLGKLDYRPNIDALQYFIAEIWPLIHSRIPEAKFVIVGKGMSENLRSSLVSKHVIVKGYVEDIRNVLSICTAVVVPLRYGGGTRIKILEALAMGKPVISSSLGCEGIEILNGKEILVADSPESFAESVIQVLMRQDLRLKLGRMGRELVEEKYNWAKIGENLETIYLKWHDQRKRDFSY